MPIIEYKFRGNYEPGNSRVLDTFFTLIYNGPNFTYKSALNQLSFIEFSSPSSAGTISFGTAFGFLQDFSDNIADVILTGGDFGDVLRGGAGNDALNGGDGNDVLEGGFGNNTFDGGTGNNTISYERADIANNGMFVDVSTGIAFERFDIRINDTFSNIQNVIGSAFDDSIFGSLGNNIFEGGAGADQIYGDGGIDTARYNGSTAAVNVNLSTNVNTGGDAHGDTLNRISNLVGSTFSDTLTGDALPNTLTGNGGADALYGMGGNDRLVITDTPSVIDGGDGKDFLFVQGGGSVSLSEGSFIGIDAVYVRNDTSLDMSQVTTGSRITSQSTSGHHVEIIGTSGTDRIVAGKGGDTIEGGAGGDKLFAGAGSDTFHFEAGFGLDNLYRLNVALDRLAVDIEGVDATDIQLNEFRGGQDTIVTFAGVEDSNAIILRDVSLAEAQTALDNGLFTFGS